MDTTNITHENIIDDVVEKYFNGDEQALITHLFHRSHDGMRNTTLTGYETANALLDQVGLMFEDSLIDEETLDNVHAFIETNPRGAAEYYYTETINDSSFEGKRDSEYLTAAINAIIDDLKQKES